ncbi:hypothetical protein ACWCPM_02550 [Streptomyces sp. NPDC002309]
MAEVRDGAATGRELPRGHTRWGVFTAIATVPLLIAGTLVAGLVAAFVLIDDEEAGGYVPEKTDCTRALAFGGAALPEGARTESCTVSRGIDRGYTAVFRMPRADVSGWLAGTYPDAPAPGSVCEDADADLCLDLGLSDALPGPAGAHAVRVAVEHEDARTALVRFSAFTM